MLILLVTFEFFMMQSFWVVWTIRFFIANREQQMCNKLDGMSLLSLYSISFSSDLYGNYRSSLQHLFVHVMHPTSWHIRYGHYLPMQHDVANCRHQMRCFECYTRSARICICSSTWIYFELENWVAIDSHAIHYLILHISTNCNSKLIIAYNASTRNR